MDGPSKKSILLVNPWIHDFSAYDLWMKPLGLLYLGGILRARGYKVGLLDCLDPGLFPAGGAGEIKLPGRKAFGQGHLYRQVIPKPEALRGVARQYCRYGVSPGVVEEHLRRLPRPDLVLVGSSMTYWYPGVEETIGVLRRQMPGVPVVLGGIYATLCPDHARRNSGADRVLAGPWDREKMETLAGILGDAAGPREESFPSWPFPAFDLYPRLPYVCLLTRSGCPFSCTYCASHRLARGFESRPPREVVQEIAHWSREYRVRDFAFYDDALLLDPPAHILPILRGVMEEGLSCRFHTPNALHARAIDRETALALRQGGFQTLRLGFETSAEGLQAGTGGKVTNQDLRRAVDNLRKAGYSPEEIGVYLMAGLPGQRVEEVEESVAFVKGAGARPILAEFSPIPGTPLFDRAAEVSPYDIRNEPLFQNNSLFSCGWEGFTWADFVRVKQRLHRGG